jgi:DNA helicase-2/ATP-dependent DNA helicase PcrA
MPTEKQRLIYVAISRPRSLLCIGVHNSVSDDELKKQFNNEITIL